MKKVLFALFAMVAAVSCNTGKGSAYPPGYEVVLVNIEHRVHGYWFFDGIEMWEPDSGSIESGIYVPHVHIGMSKPEYLAAFNSEGEEFDSYIERCDRFGDWGCDDYSFYSGLLSKGVIGKLTVLDYPYIVYSGVEFVKIDVSCESDFDADHPAGASLSDIMVFMSYTFRPNIEGLQGLDRDICFDPVPDSEWDRRLTPAICRSKYGVDCPIYKRLDRLTEYDLSMIGIREEDGYIDASAEQSYCLGSMYFLRIPEKMGAYKFRISFLTADGREMVMHPTYQWEERDATIL